MTKLITMAHYDGAARRALSDSVRPQQSWVSLWIKVLDPSSLFMVFQQTETTRQDAEAHLPNQLLDNLPVQQASELKSSDF